MALVVLVKLVLWLLGSCVELATVALLRGLVLAAVAAVELIRLPGQAADALLEVTKDALAAAGEFVFAIVRDVLVAVASAFLEFLWSVVAGTAELAASAVLETIEATRDGGEAAAKAVEAVLESAAEALSEMARKLAGNYMNALGLFLGNLN